MINFFRLGHRFRFHQAGNIHAHALPPTDRKMPNVLKPMSALLFAPHSLGLKSRIPNDLMASICQLPEIRTALNSASTINLRLQHRQGVLENNNPLKTVHESMRNIQRAAEIFMQFAPGGKEHLATLLLQVDTLTDSGFPKEASDKLKEYLAMNEVQKRSLLDPFCLLLAQSKLAWINGHFDKAIEHAQVASDQCVSEEADDLVYKQTLALNALALSRMVQIDLCTNQADLSSVIEMEDILGTFKIASRISSNEYRLSKSCRHRETQSVDVVLTTAIAHCNQGVAELLFIHVKNKKTLASSPKSSILSAHVLPIDPAMTAWRQAISYLEDWAGSNKITNSTQEMDELNHDQLLVDLLRAKIYCNMCHALLFSSNMTIAAQSPIIDTDLKSASDFASCAIKIYNTYITSNTFISLDFSTLWTEESQQSPSSSTSQGVHIRSFLQHDLARALTLAASCYAKSGFAVTAQGLFQSSMDILESSQGRYPWPLTALDARTAFLGYADLCRQWEKRDTDYRLNEDKAKKIEESMEHSWKQKPSILSGVCFQC